MSQRKIKTQAKENKGAKQKQGGILGFLRTLVTALIIVMIVNGVLVASFVVPTGSMKNEVQAGDFLFVNRFLYGPSTPQVIPFLNIPIPYYQFPGLRDPEKGDVIVFIYPGDVDQAEASQFQYYLKRCVATAGDKLEIKDNVLHINGVKADDPEHILFAPSPINRAAFPPSKSGEWTNANYGPITIPSKGDVVNFADVSFVDWKVFIEREGHKAERRNGVVYIDGKKADSYTVERNYCFGMGDNRNQSADSRFWGFIPYENVVGTPMMVYMSFDFENSSLGDKITSPRFNRIGTIID